MTTPSAGTWSQQIVGGHECEIYEPPSRNPYGYVVVYLHGVHQGRLSEHEPYTRLLAEHGLPCVGPRTMRSWWTDRICPEFDPEISAEKHVTDRVMPWIRETYGAEPPRIALLGTSMGGQGALRLAFKCPDRFPIVAALSPAIDFQLRWDRDETIPQMYASPEQARQDTALLHVHPLNWPRNLWFCSDPTDDPWHDGAQRLKMKLGSLGIPFECELSIEAGGHGFDYYNHMAPRAIGFIVERLDRERRRV